MAEPLRADDDDLDALVGQTLGRVGESKEALAASARLQEMIAQANARPPRIDPRTLPVRFTRLKAFAQSAAHYELAAQDDVDETIALRMGAAFHAALFANRPLVRFDGRRAGKVWERYEATQRERNAVILNVPEYDVAAGMVDAIRRHPRAMELLFDGTTLEHTIDWSIGARACRSTPDSYSRARNSDLKSSRCTEPTWFLREAKRRLYHAQLAFYGDAVEADLHAQPADNYIVGVENVAPFNVTVLRLPAETLLAGTKLCRLWWEQLVVAEATNHYAGYVESDVPFELLESSGPNVVEIDGKHHFID